MKRTRRRILAFSWSDLDSWPLEFRKEITNLMSSYIRKKHGERSESYFSEKDMGGNILINERLYGLLGRISALHTEEQNRIGELYGICNGFGDDDVHPQFIAVLLRVGDLLDLDNNRFDIFSLKHFGNLPRISVAHYKKHKSITHLLVNTKVIEVTARSDDFEVCKLNLMWFDWLKSEIEYMITHWREIAPSQLEGCLMGLPVLKVFHKKDEFNRDFVRDFELNKKKLLELFVGNNLYDSELDFIREYVQNAFDATRFQLWYELDIRIKREFFLKDRDAELGRLMPIDLTKNAYDNFPVYIRVEECVDDSKNRSEDKFVLEISDVGIGVDDEGINSIAHIGAGWRERSNYTEVIRKMRQWFRPTGGFGIGLQSAFMLTNEVRMLTKSAYKTGYRITLSQDGEPNDILVEHDLEILNQGTNIHLEIEFDKMNMDKILEAYGEEPKGDFFAYEDKLKIVYRIIMNYVRKQFPDSLFPIIVQLKRGKNIETEQRIQSNYFFDGVDGNGNVPDYKNYISVWNGRTDGREEPDTEKELLKVFFNQLETHKIPYDKIYVNLELERGILRVWDDGAEAFYYIELSSSDEAFTSANYKNVGVLYNSGSTKKDNGDQWVESPYLTNVVFDVMGSKVEDCLLVSRNRFRRKAFEARLMIDSYVTAYFHMMLESMNYKKTLKRDRLFDLMMISGTVIDTEKHARNITDWQSGGLWVWEHKIEGDSCFLNKTYYLYDQIFTGLQNDELIIAIPEDVSKAEMFPDKKEQTENRNAMYEFYSHLLIVDDIKTITVLRYYCMKSEKTVFRISVSGDENNRNGQDSRGEKPSFQAFRVIHDKARMIAGLKVLLGESADDVKVRQTGSSLEQERTGMGRFERRYDKAEDSGSSQEPLLVNRIPFKESEPNMYYIIRPYSNTVNDKINQRIHDDSELVGTGERRLTQQEFVDIVMEDATFLSLCRWVFRHQKYPGKYCIAQIREAYRYYIVKDYEKSF